jgi:hypothetical protein
VNTYTILGKVYLNRRSFEGMAYVGEPYLYPVIELMAKKYFIQQYTQEEYMHGGIGGTDAEKILLAKGFEPVFFPYHNSFSFWAKISRLFFLLKMFSRIKKGSAVIFLFPVYAKMNKLLLKRLVKKGNVQLICLIADINGLKDGDEKLLQKEIEFFKQFNFFIAHNEKMKQWLHQQVAPGCVVSSIDFFDFLTAPITFERSISFDIVFAGNLEKSKFLEELYLLNKEYPDLHFHLYGQGQTDTMLAQKNVTYHGAEKPYELPAKLKGSFGLLWDGDSINKPGGSLGHYMQYISHHKLSLYILSKLPVIVPATAASAPLIEKYRIGFAVNNLYEIEDKIKNISADEYRQMQTNMEPLAERISKGKCLGDAIDEIIKL